MTNPLEVTPPFASRLRAARVRRGWTQRRLGQALKRPLVTIESWERGTRVPHRDVQAVVLGKVGRGHGNNGHGQDNGGAQ